MEKNIEEQKVPLTVKQLVVYLIGVVMTIAAIIGYYNSLKSGQEENQKRIITIEADIKALQEENKTKEARAQELKDKIIILETENKYRTK